MSRRLPLLIPRKVATLGLHCGLALPYFSRMILMQLAVGRYVSWLFGVPSRQ